MKNAAKRFLTKKFLIPFILSHFIVLSLLFVVFLSILGMLYSNIASNEDCTPASSFTGAPDSGAVPISIEEFVKSHKEAYILSWKAGGFLPSASITQTMAENGFDFINPYGTSFWKAHNMGGVKNSKREDFPLTIATFGEEAVDLTGTKPGTNVGDGTGGAYVWFKDYNAGIVGKAEFMAHQTLYKGAINNTDGLSSLSAIAQGGWATDGSYLVKLHAFYNSLGKRFQWLDQEAIAQYGSAPFKAGNSVTNRDINIPNRKTKTDSNISSSKRDELLKLAKSRLGIPYVWGGTDWDKGMDCSGLTMNLYKRIGIDIPRVSEEQSKVVKKIDKSQAKVGDLVFWGEAGSSHHVAIYIGEGKAIEEPQPGEVCKERVLGADAWYGTVDGLNGESDANVDDDGCVVTSDMTAQVVGQNSAPTLTPPKEYEGKLTLPPPDNKTYEGNNYPFGQCTFGAYNRMAQIGKKIEWFSGDGGNGGSWGASARARGYTVIKGKPEVGWAASFFGGLAGSTPPYGHIAVVEFVNPDGSILISEANVVQIGSGAISYRVIDKATVDQVEFIQGKG